MSYNLTFLDESNNILELLVGVNDGVNGWFVGLLLISIWILIFIAYQQFDTLDVLLGSSFIIAIFAGLFATIGLLAWWTISIPITLLVFAIFARLWQ